MKKVVFLLLLVLLVSCSPMPQTDVAGKVDLNDLQPLPTAQGHETVPLRVAVAAVISPKGTVESYAPFLDYLEAKLNRPVELVQRRTYLEVNDLIERGEVDIAFVCTSAYVQGHDSFGIELLVATSGWKNNLQLISNCASLERGAKHGGFAGASLCIHRSHLPEWTHVPNLCCSTAWFFT
jgi:ABC-type phosphate/phosphonate transport system substrate-binding protein